MAKLSGRPPSRQSQDAPAARATRSTRSASREASERPASRSKQNTAPATPKRGGKKATKAEELPTVEEHVTVEDQLQAEIERSEQEALDEVAAEEIAARRASVHSGMSGTTFKTSFSQEEISELDAEIMIDVLPDFASAANKLAELLAPVDPKARAVVRKEIRVDGSKYNKLFKNRIQSLETHKASFGSTEYINPSVVLRALFGVQDFIDVPTGPWRPDAVVYKINLAQMLRSVLITAFDNIEMTRDAIGAIETLDLNFASTIAGSDFNPAAVELCLSILTQLTIMRLSSYLVDQGFNPERVITDTFYSDEDGNQLFRHREALALTELDQGDKEIYSTAISQLADELMRFFQDAAGPVAALGAIRTKYPWDSFVEQVVQYYFARRQELDGQIAAQGGADQIMAGLSQEVEHRARAKVAEEKRQSFGRPGGTPKKPFGKGAIKQLRAMERQNQLAASTAPAAPTAQMTEAAIAQPDNTAPPPDDGFQRLEDDDVVVQPQQAQSTARSTLQVIQGLQDAQQQRAAKGKGRITDRQQGAQKVAFDESQLTQYNVPPQFQYPSSSTQPHGPYYQSPRGGKRSRQEAEEEGEEEDDFEPTQDQPFDTAAADQRRREAPHSRPQQHPRSSAAAGASSAPAAPARASASATPSPTKRQRKNPGSTIPPPPATLDPDDDAEISHMDRIRRAQTAARYATIRSSQQRPAQARTGWSPDEVTTLIDLIESEGDGGISYSKLKAYDDSGAQLLANRTAEDMRFKARNLKQTFLMGRTALPRNFEYVVLDKKAIVKLHQNGIEYNQDRLRGGLAAEPII